MDNLGEKTFLVDEKIIPFQAERQKVEAEERSHRPDCRPGISLALQDLKTHVQMVSDNIVVTVYGIALDAGLAELPVKKQAVK